MGAAHMIYAVRLAASGVVSWINVHQDPPFVGSTVYAVYGSALVVQAAVGLAHTKRQQHARWYFEGGRLRF